MFYGLDAGKVQFLVKTQRFSIQGLEGLCDEAMSFVIGSNEMKYVGVVLNFPVTPINLRKTFDIEQVILRNGCQCFVVSLNARNRGRNLAIFRVRDYSMNWGNAEKSSGFLRKPSSISMYKLDHCAISNGVPESTYGCVETCGILLAWRGAKLYDVSFHQSMSPSMLYTANMLKGNCTITSDDTYKPGYEGSYIDIRQIMYTKSSYGFILRGE